jgi:hypothetical protein
MDALRHADTAAERAADGALEAEDRRADTVVDWHADAGAVGAAGRRIAAIGRVVDTDKPCRAGHDGEPATALPASRDLPAHRLQADDGRHASNQEPERAPA